MEVQLSEERLRRLMEVGPWLISRLDLETVLDRLLQTAREVTGARYAALGVLDDERRHLERFLTRGLTEQQELRIGARPRGRGILGLLTVEPRPLRLADISAHERSFGFPPGHPPMRSFLGVPIMIGDAAWGNLYLADKQDGEFDAEDEQTVTILAYWAAIAIEHSRALAEANARAEALQEAHRRLEAMQAVAVAVGAETDLSQVLELIAERGRAIAEARSVLILLQEGDELVIVAGAGEVTLKAGFRLPITESTSGEALLRRRAIRVDDAEAELRISARSLGVPDARSALLVPLIYRDQALGVLGAFDRERGGSFTDAEEQLLTAFAASAATAVATAKTVQTARLRHSLEAAEAERKHWARELHDETLQALGGLKLLASTARRHPEPGRIRNVLDELISGLDVEIENLHAIITSLRPAALDDLGLRPAIEALAAHHRTALGLDVETHLRLPDPQKHEHRLAPELEITIYRLVQEAMTNAAKHAEASRVDVTVAAHDGRVNIRVADDGKGFDSSQTSHGFGLTGMRERVAMAGGELELVSSPGGTTVAVVLPSAHVAERAAG